MEFASKQSTKPLPKPTNLDDLVCILRKELGDDGLDSQNVDVERIRAIMGAYESNEADWSKYAFFDKGRYTRNLVDDGNGKFNLLILAWGEDQKSAIHDHSNSHCLMKILDGTLTEETFPLPEGNNDSGEVTQGIVGCAALALPTPPNSNDSTCSADSGIEDCNGMTKLATKQYERNQVAYISDKIGIHRVANNCAKGAVSLHLYTPPFSEFRTFTENGVARKCGNACFYSMYGKKVERCLGL